MARAPDASRQSPLPLRATAWKAAMPPSGAMGSLHSPLPRGPASFAFRPPTRRVSAAENGGKRQRQDRTYADRQADGVKDRHFRKCQQAESDHGGQVGEQQRHHGALAIAARLRLPVEE